MPGGRIHLQPERTFIELRRNSRPAKTRQHEGQRHGDATRTVGGRLAGVGRSASPGRVRSGGLQPGEPRNCGRLVVAWRRKTYAALDQSERHQHRRRSAVRRWCRPWGEGTNLRSSALEREQRQVRPVIDDGCGEEHGARHCTAASRTSDSVRYASGRSSRRCRTFSSTTMAPLTRIPKSMGAQDNSWPECWCVAIRTNAKSSGNRAR